MKNNPEDKVIPTIIRNGTPTFFKKSSHNANIMKNWLSVTFKVVAWVGMIFCFSVAYLGAMDSYDIVNDELVNYGRGWDGTIQWVIYGIITFLVSMLFSKLAKASQSKIDENGND